MVITAICVHLMLFVFPCSRVIKTLAMHRTLQMARERKKYKLTIYLVVSNSWWQEKVLNIFWAVSGVCQWLAVY